jgi:hypothetical protein
MFVFRKEVLRKVGSERVKKQWRKKREHEPYGRVLPFHI